MTFASPDPIVSGRVYTIIDIKGQEPLLIDDFVGATEFSLAGDGVPHLITGVGAADSHGVRFYEKDPFHHGKDVRIWDITPTADGRFSAQHAASI